MKCPKCMFENPEGAKFCNECGHDLRKPKETPPVDYDQPQSYTPKHLADKILTTRSSIEGERKLVTVMFADISGFTALAETMDPEAVRELMNACFDHLLPVVEKYEGTVDKFIGDEIMALFGAPVAHENDPERALRAALEMMESLAAFNGAHGTDLGMHFGINTGLVIAGGIGSEGRQQYSVMGDTVNLAARLKDASERGEIFVGPDTYRLAAPLFEFEPLEPIEMKGKAEPVAVHRLLATRAVRDKGRGIEGLRSAMVGRDAELEQLQAAIGALQEGQGSAISIIAEAGLGKSRLVAEARQASSAKVPWVEGRALSYAQGMSYWIARDVLRGLLRVEADATLEEISAALQGSIESILPERGSEDVWPYLAHLLDLPLDEAVAGRIAQFGPQALQERILGAFSGYVRARSQQPLVLVWEDLHWADGSSLNLLETLLPLTAEVPLLVLLVFRPEEGATWDFHRRLDETQAETYQPIELHPLSRDESARLVQGLLKIENLPDRTRALILDKAEGNPLFLEELLRSLIDAGMVLLQAGRTVATDTIHELKAIDVPDTVQGVIASRIDRLPANDKYTLQTAAVIGRTFQKRVLKYLLDREQATIHLDASLDELRRQEFVRLREALAGEGVSSDLEYIFKHVLTQETAYNSMLIAQRQALHKVAGEAIEALFPERLDELAAPLAFHFERAGVLDKAISFLLEAGNRAVKLSANEEATGHFSQGLELLKGLPDTPERTGRELGLQVPLAVALMNLRGYGDSEVGQAYTRAHELCNQIGETPQIAPVLNGLWSFYFTRAEYKPALELAEQILRIAPRAEDPTSLLLIGHNAQNAILSLLGKSNQALMHAEQLMGIYDPQKHRALIFSLGQDLKATSMSWVAFNLWLRGYPDQARKMLHDTLGFSRELAHPYTLSFAYLFADILYQFCRDVQAVQELAGEWLTLSTEYGFLVWIAFATIFRDWSLVEQGQTAEGVAQMRQNLTNFQLPGTGVMEPYCLAMLADAHRKAGQPEEGLAALDEGLALVEKTGERFYEAEIHRLKGELLLAQGADEAEVEEHYKQAIEVARELGAKSWELRAVMSLSRLWQKQGKQEEARQVLAEIYGWFTEGFDTADLKEAKGLLEKLA